MNWRRWSRSLTCHIRKRLTLRNQKRLTWTHPYHHRAKVWNFSNVAFLLLCHSDHISNFASSTPFRKFPTVLSFSASPPPKNCSSVSQFCSVSAITPLKTVSKSSNFSKFYCSLAMSSDSEVAFVLFLSLWVDSRAWALTMSEAAIASETVGVNHSTTFWETCRTVPIVKAWLCNQHAGVHSVLN